MPFVRMKGVVGKVYVPDKPPADSKKHPCKNCFSCQMCGDDRCRICRDGACRLPDPISASKGNSNPCGLKS